MKATEAKSITKLLTIEEVFKWIESAAKAGHNKYFIPHMMYVPDDIKLKLGVLGYKIYHRTDSIGMDCIIIEW